MEYCGFNLFYGVAPTVSQQLLPLDENRTYNELNNKKGCKI